MNKALKLNFLLLRKEFVIYGFRNIMIVLLTMTAVLVGVRYLLFLVPERGLLELYLMLGVVILTLPFSDVSYLNMNTGHQKMLTYFKSIPALDVQNYYLYRKFTAFTIVV